MIFIKISLMKTLENSITRTKHWQITLVHLWYFIQGLHIMANGRTTMSKIVVQVTNAINRNNCQKKNF